MTHPSVNNPFPWTSDQIAILIQLFEEGYPFSYIAEQLSARYNQHLTRNAALGKCHRLGLKRGTPIRFGPRSPRPPREPRPPRPHKARSTPFRLPRPPRPRKVKPAPAVTSEPPGAFRCDLMGLTNESCRYAVTENSPYIFCGFPEADLLGGKPYCNWHSKIVYGRREPEREAA